MRFLEKWRSRSHAERDQHVYVSERCGVRSLHIGSDTVQSSMRLTRPNDLELSYTRSMMAFRLFVPSPREVLMIGLGGGSLAKFVYHRLSSTRVQIVEINPQVVAIARRSFFVPADEPRFQVITADGAVHVQREEVCADVIAIDGYEADVLVEELASPAFYADCRSSLRKAGVASINLWGGDKLFHTLLQRIKNAFPGILCLPAERPGNIVVFGFERKPPPFALAALAQTAAILEAEDGLEYPRFVEGLKKMNPHDSEFLYA
jgi:spermidine synthase